jgi:hypothetical protein
LSYWTRKFVKINFIHFSIIYFMFFLFRGANHTDSQHYQYYSGFYIDIFNILKDRLKFEFELHQVLDRTWGSPNLATM